mmetsp:Transcript_127566/g.369303  ORF Transcript_127566/g.369303 Transcript_127566/m.369303 type:complete len:434 (-) Transcript_127566:271-1572(-)
MSSDKEFLIVGGGMGGLVLALGLQKFCGIQPEVVDQAPGFGDGVGGAIGMYANGLQVIRDIDPELLKTLRKEGYDYIYRRWYRHDGTEVACADESLLTPPGSSDEVKKELTPIGIRRWKLQKALYEACVAAKIPIHFDHAVKEVVETDDGMHEIRFWQQDKSPMRAKYVFGADGVKSKVREAVIGSTEQNPEYTGVTCLMGASNVPRPVRGISFPSSVTTKCHMCTYPTAEDESIFQIYFPTPVENPDEWGMLSKEQEKKECIELADRLTKDGWDDQFVKPLREAIPGSVVRVGLRSREPVSTWVKGRMVLLGDAAHPPVPYIGQGAMMAIEDAGTLCRLIQNVCCDSGKFDETKFARATKLYQDLRLPRTAKILGSSHELGKTQQKRAESWIYNLYREYSIKLQVLLHGTLPIMIPGSTFDYAKAVDDLLAG